MAADIGRNETLVENMRYGKLLVSCSVRERTLSAEAVQIMGGERKAGNP